MCNSMSADTISKKCTTPMYHSQDFGTSTDEHTIKNVLGTSIYNVPATLNCNTCRSNNDGIRAFRQISHPKAENDTT